MATVPVTRTWVAGEIVTAGYMNNNLTAVLNFLLAPPICQVRAATTQSFASGSSFVSVNFDAEDVDSTGMHSTVSNTSRITGVYPGWYRASGGANCGSSTATGRRMLGWKVNGTGVLGGGAGQAGTTQLITLPARGVLVYLNVGDYLELGLQQDSGSSMGSYVGVGDWQPSACVNWESN